MMWSEAGRRTSRVGVTAAALLVVAAMQLVLASPASAGYAGCDVTVSDTTPSPGQQIMVDGTGDAGASVSAMIGTTTVGSGTADAVGSFSFSAEVPESAEGTVVLNVSCGGEAVASVSLTVASPPETTGLPRTGPANALALAALGLVTLNLGSLALAASRRRHNVLP